MRLISAAQVKEALPFEKLIPALKKAFREGANVPLRHHHAINNGTLLLMPASNATYFGTKIVSVFPNASPTVQGVYLLSNGQTGEPLCLIEGKSLTARRTAAVSALASNYLSNTKAKTLLMVGAGALAQPLIEAHCATRSFSRILLFNRSHERALALKAIMPQIEIIASLQQGVEQADIVSCATLSHTPLIKGEWLKEGAHLDLIGGFTPQMREADDVCLARSRLYVDTFAGALSEAGDIVEPLSRGVISKEDILGDLASLCQHPKPSWQGNTLFKSVGTALSDLAAAILVSQNVT
jgi:alanine dehydrogenase